MRRPRPSTKLAIIGAGQMAEGLVGGLLESGTLSPESLWATDLSQERRDLMARRFQIRVGGDNAEAASWAQTVLLAVKPQGLASVLETLAPILLGKLVVSIAAGIPISWMAARLPSGVRIIRAMPNVPVLVGKGMTVLAIGPGVNEAQIEVTQALFAAVGRVAIVEERSMDAVTGLSGSGPAYACLAIEAMADGGVLMGISRPLAQLLAAQTLMGAAKMMLEFGEGPGHLNISEMSPAGITAAGMECLERGGLREALMTAVQAATRKSEELGRLCL